MDLTTLWAAIACYVHENKLYISHEAVKTKLDIDKIKPFIEKNIPDIGKHTIYADCANPEQISFLKKQGMNIKPVSKGKGSIEDGIAYMRSFDFVYIHERCLHTANEFQKYSYKVDPRSGDIEDNIVDKENHCLVGDTLVNTKLGQFKIKNLVNTEGLVQSITDNGSIKYNKYSHVRKTQKNALVFECFLSDSSSIVCTQDHMFLTVEHGWQPLSNIKTNDQLVVLADAMRCNVKKKQEVTLCQNKLYSKGKGSIKILKRIITNIVQQGSIYIDMCICFLRELYQRGGTFITKTITNSTTIFQTLFVCQQASTLAIMAKTLVLPEGQKSKQTLIKLDHLLKLGINPKLVTNGIKKIGKSTPSSLLSERQKLSVNNVTRSTKSQQSALKRVDFVATLASQLLEEKQGWITFKKNVLSVVRNTSLINILKSKHAAFVAEQHSVTVTAIKECGYQDVYNLEVENDHNYTIEGGVVTHNCVDSIRYALERSMKRKGCNYKNWDMEALRQLQD